MKVICVFIEGEFEDGCPHTSVGDIFTVKNTHLIHNEYYYEFEEIKDFAFKSKCFSPLSDIDETELVNEKECITQL